MNCSQQDGSPGRFTANHLTRASLERSESKEIESRGQLLRRTVHDVNVG